MQNWCVDAERCQILFSCSSDPVFVISLGNEGPSHEFLDVNEAASRMLGYTTRELLELSPDCITAPECGPGFFGTHLEQLQTTGDVLFEATQISKNGRRIPVEIHATQSTFGTRKFVVAIARDLSDRRNAYERIRANEELLRTVISNIDGVVFCVDRNGDFVLSEGKTLSALGLKPGEVVGQSVFDIYRDYPQIIEAMNVALGGTPHSMQVRVQGVVFDTFISPIHDASGTVSGAVGISTDITQREEAREQLIHSSKLAAIGTLAAGIAHEIQNPLTIMRGFIPMMKMQLQSMGNSQELIQILEKQDRAADRIVNIVRSLRSFARTEPAAVENVNTHKVILDTIGFYDTIYARSGLTLQTNLRATNPVVKANSGKLEQLVLNLLSNAKDACESNSRPGRITIETFDDSQWLVLQISDNGTGISRENLVRIFDPFFTTKPREHGTGLGLSISQAIIQSFGGSITARSELGTGTTFEIRLVAIQEC